MARLDSCNKRHVHIHKGLRNGRVKCKKSVLTQSSHKVQSMTNETPLSPPSSVQSTALIRSYHIISHARGQHSGQPSIGNR